MPATFTKSGTGRKDAGSNRDRITEYARMAVRVDRTRDVQDDVTLPNVLRTKEIAVSIGSVRCWTSARTAKRISR